MDAESFEDVVLSADLIGEDKVFLVPNLSYDVLFVDDKAVQIQLPAAIEMEVMESPDAVRGDSATNVQKPVITETGLSVQVPLFIKKGEKIRISTSERNYLGRA